MKLYGLIGYPLGHSFSKQYFTEKFSLLGITDHSYEAFAIKSIAELPGLLKANGELCGLNVTIPYKQDILPFLTDVSHLPEGVLACNCISISGEQLIGYNTDVIGFEQSLVTQLKPQHSRALILGSGGAAEAIKYVLTKLNVSFKVVSRKLHEGSDLVYGDLDETIIKEHLLIINTTPLGTFPNVAEYPAIPYHHLTPAHYLFDLVYNPSKTVFLQKGEAKGAIVKNGYEMLVLQAEESWRIWNENI